MELEPTTDILGRLGETRSSGQRLIGFAAEHGGGAVERARGKLVRKRVDMIVVNDISRPDIGFDQDANEITIVTSHGEKAVSRRSKQECAAAIWDAAEMLAGIPAATVR
jgi:phosphopantothenoylcysteine decarboxylase/phosphopantothenate--cysteine ligase